MSGEFKIKNVVNLLDENARKILLKSDLTLQAESVIYQYDWESEKEGRDKVTIKPGSYSFMMTNSGIKLDPLSLKQRNILETVTNTAMILDQAKKFFSKLHIYEATETRPARPKKRAVLLTSGPGMGKTATIEKAVVDMMKEDPGTVVCVWPSNAVESDAIVSFMLGGSEYAPEVTRLILIIEDIGGAASNQSHRNKGVDTGMLNFLDGVGDVFKVPTFIIATTNYPESLGEALADRPNRFDRVLELKAPKTTERLALVKFLAGRELTELEVGDLSNTDGVETLSIAHLQEIVFRSELEDQSFGEVIKSMVKHKKQFKRGFEKEENRMGFNIDEDDYE